MIIVAAVVLVVGCLLFVVLVLQAFVAVGVVLLMAALVLMVVGNIIAPIGFRIFASISTIWFLYHCCQYFAAATLRIIGRCEMCMLFLDSNITRVVASAVTTCVQLAEGALNNKSL